jgi:hypothetical protein
MSTVEIRVASEREQQAVIDVTTLAFATDPMARWAYPNPRTYQAVVAETIKAFGDNGFAHGTERHGLEVLGSIQAGSSPTVVPMLRRPAAL